LCKTKPISRVFGLQIGIERKNKANFETPGPRGGIGGRVAVGVDILSFGGRLGILGHISDR